MNSYLKQPTEAKPKKSQASSETPNQPIPKPQTASPQYLPVPKGGRGSLEEWVLICPAELVSEWNEKLCPDFQAHLESVFVKLRSLIRAIWMNLGFLRGSSLSEAAECCLFFRLFAATYSFYPQQFLFYLYLPQVLNRCWRSETTHNCKLLWCSSVLSWLAGNTTAQLWQDLALNYLDLCCGKAIWLWSCLRCHCRVLYVLDVLGHVPFRECEELWWQIVMEIVTCWVPDRWFHALGCHCLGYFVSPFCFQLNSLW